MYAQAGAKSLEALSGRARPVTFQSCLSHHGEDWGRKPLRRLLSRSREAVVAGPGQAVRDLGSTEASPLPAPAGPTFTRDQVRDSGDLGAESKESGWQSGFPMERSLGRPQGSTCGAPWGHEGVSAGGGPVCADAWVRHPCSRGVG